MANLALVTADRVYVVESFEQATAPAAEAIEAGAPVRFDTSTGRFTNANASSSAEARVYGIATRSVAAGNPVTAIKRGILDGFNLDGMDYGESVYLSDTDGTLADVTPGTIDVAAGMVIPGFASPIGTAADKLLLVDFSAAGAGGGGVAGGVGQIVASYSMLANGSLADQSFFIADRPYRVDSIREVHSVAGADAGAVSLQVTKDTGTQAPGAGADLISSVGFNLKGTANTVQTATLTSVEADLTLAAGDRLSVDFAGTLTSLAGVTVSVSLTPA